MVRLLLAAALVIGVSIMPVTSVAACSCAMPGSPAEVVASSSVTFVGTVVGTEPAGGAPPMSTISYAFEVDRASVETGPIIEVRSLDDPGGAACGFTFGLGERWLVAAYRSDAGLETNLCSGNQATEVMAPDELALYDELLVHAPVGAPAEESVDAAPILLPAALGVLAALLLGAVGWMAFRHEGR